MIEEIKSIDKSIIEKVEFKYPELMTSNAEELIKKDYYSLLELEEKLSELRMKVIQYESLLEEKRKEFSEKTSNCNIIFGTKTKEFVKDDFYSSFENTGDTYQKVFSKF